MNKALLREKYKKIRKEIIDKDLKSKEISNRLINSEIYKNSKIIALYSNLLSEVNTKDLITHSLNNNKIVALPRVIDKYNMNFYRINSIEDLNNTGSFGIKEPINDNLITNIDLIIIPGLCFDYNNNRLGFGRGYYDRYLFNNDSVYKIGLCFDEQILKDDIIEVDKYDIKMDLILTDKQLIFNEKSKIKKYKKQLKIKI